MTPLTRDGWAVLGVIAIVTAVRVILSLELELTSVESYLWLCSRRPALGYFDHPGMVAWMGWLSVALFGSSPAGVRAMTIAGGAGLVWFVYLAARRLYDDRTGRWAAFTAALVPLFFALGSELTADAPCLLFSSATVWALAHALSGDSVRWWYAAGSFLGLALDSKYHALFLGLGTLGFLLLSPEHRGWLRRREPWLSAALALAMFSPTLVWNAGHGWESFEYQGLSRFHEEGFRPSQLWRFPWGQLLWVTPVLLAGAWAAGLSTLVRWRASDWRDRFLAALGMPLLIFFLLVNAIRPVRAHWTMHGYLTTLMLSAAMVLRAGSWGRRGYLASLAVLGSAYLISPAGVALVPREKRQGWSELAAHIARRRFDFIVCNDYHLASQVGYQLGTTESWDLTPAGNPTKSFPNWWSAEAHRGKTALLVFEGSHFPGDLALVRDVFEHVGPPEEVVVPRVKFLGSPATERYVLLEARRYRGAPAPGLMPRHSRSE